MKIINLKAQNIKKIKAIDITPDQDKSIVVIEGKNAQGKTSVLDSIAMALGGEKLIPTKPIRDGEEAASIELDIGDYVVTRTWKANDKSTLKVVNKQGLKPTGPQGFLDALIGNLSFDPMEFCRYDKAKRIECFKKIFNLDFTGIDQELNNEVFKRTNLKKAIIHSENEWNKIASVEDPGEIPSTTELLDLLGSINQVASIYDNHVLNISKMTTEIMRLEKAIAQATSDLALANQALALSKEVVSKGRPDPKPVAEEIKTISFKQEQKKQFEQKAIFEKDLSNKRQKLEDIEQNINKLNQTKKTMIQDAKIPIEGLEVRDTDLFYNNVEFSQLSSAQQIKISMMMAMMLNPKIRIIRVLNGSLLDKESMKMVEEIAKQNDFQIWIERVSDEKHSDAIYIEEGEVHE